MPGRLNRFLIANQQLEPALRPLRVAERLLPPLPEPRLLAEVLLVLLLLIGVAEGSEFLQARELVQLLVVGEQDVARGEAEGGGRCLAVAEAGGCLGGFGGEGGFVLEVFVDEVLDEAAVAASCRFGVCFLLLELLAGFGLFRRIFVDVHGILLVFLV